MAEIFARIHPFAPPKGFFVVNYTHSDGTAFKGGLRPPWYKVTPNQQRELEKIKQVPDDPYSKPLFEFKDKEQMKDQEQRERDYFIAARVLRDKTMPDSRHVPQARVVDVTANDKTGRQAAIPEERSMGPSESPTASYAPEDPDLAIEEESWAAADLEIQALEPEPKPEPKPTPKLQFKPKTVGAIGTADLPQKKSRRRKK